MCGCKSMCVWGNASSPTVNTPEHKWRSDREGFMAYHSQIRVKYHCNVSMRYDEYEPAHVNQTATSISDVNFE